MGNVNPRMWDDDRVIPLSPVAKLVWCYCLTSAQDVPGLLRGGTMSIAEGLRLETSVAQEALHELASTGLVEYDNHHRLLRIPSSPKHNTPSNPNVLLGWWRKWQQLPGSPLKHRHVAALRDVLDRLTAVKEGDGPVEARKRATWKATWDVSFGTLPVHEETVQGNLFEEDHLNRSQIVSERFGESFRKRHIPEQKQKQISGTETDIRNRDPEYRSLLVPEEWAGAGDANGSSQHVTPEKPDLAPPAKGRRGEQPSEPLPFTIADLLGALRDSSQGRIAVEPFDRRLASPLTAVIRQCAAASVTLDDVHLAGQWIAAGGLSWMSAVDTGWIAKVGALMGAVANARSWAAQGKPALHPRAGPSRPHGESAADLMAEAAALRAAKGTQ